MKIKKIKHNNSFYMNGFLYDRISKNTFLVVKDGKISRFLIRIRNKMLGII